MTFEEVRVIYQKIDEELKDEKKCCTKGCSACCYQQIEVMSFERDAIKEFVANKLDTKIKESVKLGLIKWFDFFDENTPNVKLLSAKDIFDNFGRIAAKANLKCPFLINNLCSIYEMRPSACRIHFVVDNPELCSINSLRETAMKGIQFRIQFMDKLKKTVGVILEPLTYVVKDEILPNRVLKNMQKGYLF